MNNNKLKAGFFVLLSFIISVNAFAKRLDLPKTVAPPTKSIISLGTNLTYQWKASEEASSYDFKIYDSWLKKDIYKISVDAEQACDSGVCSFSAPELIELLTVGRYVWKVRAIEGRSKSRVANSILLISDGKPEQPVVVSPVHQSEHKLPASLDYQWLASEGATRYDFRLYSQTSKKNVYRDAKVQASVCDSVTSICKLELPANIKLTVGNYVWRVRASNGIEHSSFARSKISIDPAQGTLVAGYDWGLPAYANQNQRGGLIRGTWDTDKAYTNAAFYSLRWNQAPFVASDVEGEKTYDFSLFQTWLDNYSSGDNVLVRLDVNSLCDTPMSLRSTFNYYAGGSIAFWEEEYVAELTGFVNAFAAKYAANPRIIGVHLGIADGEYKHIEPGQYGGLDEAGEYQDVCPANPYHGDDGWGEFGIKEDELKHAMEQGLTAENFTTSVIDIINVYADAFAPINGPDNSHKLAMTNLTNFVYNDAEIQIVPDADIQKFEEQKNIVTAHALARGVGYRGGLLEDWMSYNDPTYGMNFTPGPDKSCYWSMDEAFAENLGNRYWGTENEEYGNKPWWFERYGAFEEQPYRFLMSSLRTLQMRHNHMSVDTAGMDDLLATDYKTADFLHYLTNTLGRDKTDTPDAFVVLGERYVRAQYVAGFEEGQFASPELESCMISRKNSSDYVQVREFGRWLTEVGGKGVKSSLIALEPWKEPWSIPSTLPDMEGASKYEFSARESNQFTFDINDAVVSNRCPQELACDLMVKVVFEDKVATTLSVKTEYGVVATVETLGDGAIKTASFALNDYFKNGFQGADFGLVTGVDSEALPVMMTRVNFLAE